MHQPQQLRCQTGRGWGYIEQIFQLGVLRLSIAGQYHAHAGAAALAKGHQHHTAQTHRILVLRQNSVGIQLIKMEGRIADGNAYRLGHSSNSFNA